MKLEKNMLKMNGTKPWEHLDMSASAIIAEARPILPKNAHPRKEKANSKLAKVAKLKENEKAITRTPTT